VLNLLLAFHALGLLVVQSRNPEMSKWQGVGMFSLKLSYLPSSDERVQSGDERSSAHPCGLTPATVTFQGWTESMLADEDKPPHVPASQQFTTNDSLWQHIHTHLWE